MNTILNVIDFDGTLINTPSKEEGIKKWEIFHKTVFPYKGWWSNVESLSHIFDYTYNQDIIKEIEKNKGYNILLTGRNESMAKNVIQVIKWSGMDVELIDEFHFKPIKKPNSKYLPTEKYKELFLIEFLSNNENFRVVNIFEDNPLNIKKMAKAVRGKKVNIFEIKP